MSATPHLLIADDDKESCALLSRFLTRYGYRVSIAQDGRVMTQVLETARINLIVLDGMLPGEDGLTLCRRLRARSTVPIIMLTGMGEETDRIVGLEIGADDPRRAETRGSARGRARDGQEPSTGIRRLVPRLGAASVVLASAGARSTESE
jgi:CheY-like chemotaxis protein